MARLQEKIKSYNNFDLWVNYTGFAFVVDKKNTKTKILMPDNRGCIYIRGRRINFKKLLFRTVYPHIDLKGKNVFRIGPTFNILNLYALTKNQFLNIKKYGLEITKNQNTGVVKLNQWENIPK